MLLCQGSNLDSQNASDIGKLWVTFIQARIILRVAFLDDKMLKPN